MKEVCFKFLCVLLLIAGMQSVMKIPKTSQEQPPKEIIVEVSKKNGEIENVSLEDYVIGVVSAEMPASFELEALKAQAVASRTFVLSRNLKVDDTTSSQVYLNKQQRKVNWQDDFETYEAKIKEAVTKTKGEVLMYDGSYISALFFSSSNGKTENNEDYFASSSVPYLQSVDSSWDLDYQSTYRNKTFSKDELNELFETDDFSIEILNYTQSGRVNEVDVCGSIYTGRQIREKLGLASNDFDVSIEDGKYVFETIGFGHGVGMSQYGANGMAQDGYSYQDILKHYYQNVSIEKIK